MIDTSRHTYLLHKTVPILIILINGYWVGWLIEVDQPSDQYELQFAVKALNLRRFGAFFSIELRFYHG